MKIKQLLEDIRSKDRQKNMSNLHTPTPLQNQNHFSQTIGMNMQQPNNFQQQQMPQMILVNPQHLFNMTENTTPANLQHPYMIKPYMDKVSNQMLT